jgi:hypothetical protein
MPIAAARLEARVVVLELVANVPLVALEQVFVPAELPVTLPHEKPVRLPPVPTERKAPGLVSVTVTVLALAVAVAPIAENRVLQALIASRRFVARVVVFELVTKVPAVALEHVCVPFVPSVTAPHEKVAADAATEKAETAIVPRVVLVTVTVLALAVAVAPTPENEVLQALIASLRFVASVAVALLVTYVPLVESVHVCVPFELPVTLAHEKPVRLPPVPTERKAPGLV